MSKQINRKINIYINGKEVKNNLNSVGKELGKLKGQIRNLTPGTEEFIKKSAELKKAKKAYKDINDEVRDTNVTLEDAQSNFANLFGGLLSGDIKMMQAGLQGISGNIKGMTKAALSFIATPLGAAIAVVSGIALGAKQWADFNIELYKTTKLTEQLTGLNGALLTDFRDDVAGTAAVFNKDYNEVLKSANSLAKQMGITHKEAIDLITTGFAKGADVNGDFLDKVKEYPVHFRNAGYSADEFIKIATQEAKGGIYSDKLLDTLKEADLSLKEMQKTQTDALENAFGAKFANEIANGIKTGELSTKEALQRIIAEADKLGLNFQQKQQLLADVFKGAGEDAGGFDEIVKQLNLSFDDQNNKLTDNEKATLRLTEATQAQNKAMADLFDASQSGFPEMLTDIKSIGKEIFTNLLRGIKLSTTSLKQMISVAKDDGSKQAINDVVEDMKRFGSSQEDAVKYKLISTEKNIARVKKQISEIGYFGKLMGDDKTLQSQWSKYIAYKDELLKIANETSKEFKAASESYINPDDAVTPTTPETEKTKTSSNTDKEKGDLTAKDQREKDSKIKLKEWLDNFEAEQEIQDAIKDLEADEAAQVKEEIELELKYEKLREQAHGDTELLKELKDAQEEELFGIQKKWDDKFWKNYKENKEKQKDEDAKYKAAQIQAEFALQNAKSQALNFGLNALKSFTKEGSSEYKALFGLQQLAAAAEVILAGQRERAAYMANPTWSAKPDGGAIIKSKFALASKIRTGISLASIAGATIKGMYDGGFTPETNFGNDRYGPITSFNHGNEYVVPEIVRADPTYASQINTLEKARTQKLDLPAENTANADNNSTAMLTEAVYMLMAKLDEPIYANAIIGDDEIARQSKRQNKLTNVRTNARIN